MIYYLLGVVQVFTHHGICQRQGRNPAGANGAGAGHPAGRGRLGWGVLRSLLGPLLWPAGRRGNVSRYVVFSHPSSGLCEHPAQGSTECVWSGLRKSPASGVLLGPSPHANAMSAAPCEGWVNLFRAAPRGVGGTVTLAAWVCVARTDTHCRCRGDRWVVATVLRWSGDAY